jgi:hypothetical protein
VVAEVHDILNLGSCGYAVYRGAPDGWAVVARPRAGELAAVSGIATVGADDQSAVVVLIEKIESIPCKPDFWHD